MNIFNQRGLSAVPFTSYTLDTALSGNIIATPTPNTASATYGRSCYVSSGDDLNNRDATTTQRALRVVASNILNELKKAGYSREQMVTFASELLGLVTEEIKSDENSSTK
ncbi:MAG: hypothetical protein IPJ69_08670 [Deltaproteobacteria bacterium]|nr:MAG: hypothetical protein IPJ69_08670 [Deltaproteobacteria bacterium]